MPISLSSFCILTLQIAFLSLLSCNSQNEGKIAPWLEGTWAFEKGSMAYEETWHWEPSKRKWEAKGIMVIESDTIYAQEMRIEAIRDEVVLSVHTLSRNQEKEAFFRRVHSDVDTRLVFKNEFDVFPQQITYQWVSDGEIHTEARGIKNNQLQIERQKLFKLAE